MAWELGCFNRPWNKVDFDDCLAGVRAAGFEHMGFMNHQGERLVQPEHTREHIQALADQVARHGLKPHTVLAAVPLEGSAQECAAELNKVVDRTAWLGARYVLTCGTTAEEHFDKYYEIMRLSAEYAQDQGVMVTLKPHGGISATSRELRRAVERVNHPNFGIYYDPGNIHHYTGEDAAEDVKLIAEQVVAMCVKDQTGGLKGPVMITPGTGDVDFEAVMGTLKGAGFAGPLIVECLGGETLEEINQAAGETFAFLQRLIAD